MNLLSIKRAIEFNYALSRHNQTKEKQLRTIDITILFALYVDGYACKRINVIKRLKVLRRTISYTLLNNRLEYLTEQNLVEFNSDRWRVKRYKLSIDGKYFLQVFEKKIRAVRVDKLKF